MTQVSYGTITITDTNDIESIIVEYNRNQSTTTPPAENDSGWSTTRPTWAQGYYIWQRTRIHKSGTQDSADTFGTAVCLTGSTGQTGQTGATGKGITGIETLYATNNSATTAPTSGWQSQPPTYNSSNPKYWVKVTTTYNSGDPTIVTYLDNGITDAMATAAAANSTANTANQTANTANQTANTANQTANQANQTATNAYNIATGINQHFWTIATDYATGLPAGSYITDTASDIFKSQKTGGNLLTRSDGIWLRNGIKTLASLTGTSLIFYNPSSNAKGMELDSSALKFYDATGTVAQATFGGTQATISGTINVYDGKIGNNANNYWYIGNYTDYNQNYSAIIKSKGTASIQLNETNTWRISTNRIHTAWAPETGTDAFKLHFPKFNDSKTVNKYWDFGLHLPISYSDKFLYIRNASGSETLDNLLNDLDDGGYDYWKYRFYISADGSLYAKNLYVLDDDGNTTQIGGTDGVYLLKSGGTITGNLEVNGTLTKGGKTVTYLTTTPTSGQILIADGTSGSIKTSGYTIATSVPSGAIFTDYRVKTEARGSTTMYLAGSNSSGTVSQGTLLTDSGVYIQTSSSSTNLVVSKINGYTLAAASAKGVDTSLTTSSTSTNLPTSKAVVDLIKQYLPLTGGSITGPVNFGDSVSIDDLTAGNLIINGAGRFTNGLYGDLVGNADTATKVGNDLKIQLNGGTTEGTNQFTFNGSAAKTVNITKSSIGLGNVENKSSATIRGELTSSNVTTALGFTPYNATNPNGYTTNTGTVTSVKVQGSNGLTGSGTVTTSGTITLSHDDTSSQASSSNSGRTYIQSITLDGYGHVTGLSTATETVTNTHNTAYLYAGASNGTANAATTNGNTYLILMDGGSATTRRKVSGSGTVSVASDASGNITITGSAHPTSLKNPNALTVKVYNGASTSSNTSYDGSTANQSVSVAGTNAITGINSTTDGKLQLTLADGSQPDPISVKITATTSDSAASADKLNLSANVGSLTQPVYFNANTGLPAAISYTIQSNVPQNAKFTDTWTAMVGATSSANGSVGYVNAVPPKDGYNTKFLRADGTWVVPGGTYSLPLAANGTRGGVQIGYTTSGKNYAVQLSSEKMYVNVPWTDTTYTVATGDSNGQIKVTPSSGNAYNVSVKGLGSNAYTSTAYLPLSGGTMNGTARILWADSGSWGGSDATFPLKRGGLYWSGTSDWIDLFAEETSSDKLNLVINFGDDANPSLILRDRGTDAITLAPGSGTITATTFSGALSGNATTATTASWANLLKPIDTTTTASASTWSIPSGSKQVWGERFSDSTLTYTPSGGSTTTITDTGNWVMWLNPSATSNMATLNMKIDGTYYGSFSGNLSGNASTASVANQISNLTSADNASSTDTWRNVWISYNDNTMGRPAVTSVLAFQTSTGTLRATTFSGNLSGNATSATKATQDGSGNTITSTYVKKAGDTMTGALNTANGTANKIGDDSQLGDFNVGGTLGIQGLNNTTGIGLLQKGTTWGSNGNYAHITYDGTYVNLNKLFKITTSGNTVTIGSQNASYTHIYNSLSIPFIFNNSILTTSGSLGDTSYPFTNVNITGGYNMLVNNAQKAAMHYDSTLEAIVFSFA